jgi:hypothetical protein
VTYVLGSQKYKAVLHYFELAFFPASAVHLFWFSPLHPTGWAHVRAFLIGKLIKIFYSARQVRLGFPPPRATLYGESGGRSAPFWTSRVSLANFLLGHVYLAIPFLWELRVLMDWLCTRTTLM